MDGTILDLGSLPYGIFPALKKIDLFCLTKGDPYAPGRERSSGEGSRDRGGAGSGDRRSELRGAFADLGISRCRDLALGGSRGSPLSGELPRGRASGELRISPLILIQAGDRAGSGDLSPARSRDLEKIRLSHLFSVTYERSESEGKIPLYYACIMPK